MSDDSGLVRFQLDPANLPPLTDAQRAELDALAAMPDSAIDYSDIPPLPDAFWHTARRARPTAPRPESKNPAGIAANGVERSAMRNGYRDHSPYRPA